MSLLKSQTLEEEQIHLKSIHKIRIVEKNSNSNSSHGKIIDLDLSISEKNIEKIIVNFSKLCYFLDTNNLLAIQYKKHFDLIFFKLKEIRSIFEENNLDKISHLILYCIKNKIICQLYLYIIISKLLFDKDNTKSNEIINTIENLYSSLISSHGNYPLIIFFMSYYILENIREILNYIDIRLSCKFIRNIISKMSNSIYEYKNISKKLYRKKNKKENNHNNSNNFLRRTFTNKSHLDNLLNIESNEYIDNELKMLNDLLIDNLEMFNKDLNKINKYIYRDEIYDSLINCVLIKNQKSNNEYYFNRPILKYIIKNKKIEYIVIVLDKIFKLFNKVIKKEPNLLSIINDLISDIYLFYSNNLNNNEIKTEIENYFLSSLEHTIKISKEKIYMDNSTLTFYLNYIKNIIFFTIKLSEKRPIEDRLNLINSILNLFLYFLQNNNKESFKDEDFFFFNVICQNLKTFNYGLFPFKSLIDIISFFPEDKKIIQYNIMLDEIHKSQIILDNISKVEFSLSLITKIFKEKKKDSINDDEEEENKEVTITESEEDLQNILKINKLILSICNEDPNELLRLIVKMGTLYEHLSNSKKILTSNSFYQKLINNSEVAINYYLSKKNSGVPQYELNSIFILITKVYSYIQKYITNNFQYLFYDNKRIILEIIKNLNDIKDKELKEKLAYIAVEFGLLYIKIILKEKALESEKAREAIEQYYDMDEFDFGFEDAEEKELDDSNKKLKLKRSKSIKSQKENDIFIENMKRELSKKSELKIKNFSDSFSLVIKSTKKFVNVFTKTEIFNIIIDKTLLDNENSKENINDSFYDEDLSRNIFDLNVKEIEESTISKNINKEKAFVPGYSVLFEEFSKIKGKRVDLALIKLSLIEMYNYIKDYKKVNSLILEVKEECSFLNNEFERLGIISLISDKILKFINHDDNILEKDTIVSLTKFINKIISSENKKQNQKLEKELKNIKDKNVKICNYIKSKNLK